MSISPPHDLRHAYQTQTTFTTTSIIVITPTVTILPTITLIPVSFIKYRRSVNSRHQPLSKPLRPVDRRQNDATSSSTRLCANAQTSTVTASVVSSTVFVTSTARETGTVALDVTSSITSTATQTQTSIATEVVTLYITSSLTSTVDEVQIAVTTSRYCRLRTTQMLTLDNRQSQTRRPRRARLEPQRPRGPLPVSTIPKALICSLARHSYVGAHLQVDHMYLTARGHTDL